jgi:rubredoxin
VGPPVEDKRVFTDSNGTRHERREMLIFLIPAGTMRTATVGAVTLNASGAGIVKAEAGKTTYKIKCSLCGYETDNVTVDTPAEGKPYGIRWVCPRCGHKQKIALEVAAPQGR